MYIHTYNLDTYRHFKIYINTYIHSSVHTYLAKRGNEQNLPLQIDLKDQVLFEVK